MPLGAILAAAGTAALPGIMAGAAASTVNGVINARSARRSYKFSKKLMQAQAAYNADAFERENARQDYLLDNAYVINRQALKNAGYSAADPDGQGPQNMTNNNMDVPSGQQFQVPDNKFDLLAGAQLTKTLAEAENIKADTDKTKTDNQVAQEQLKALEETLPERIAKIKSEYYQVTKQNRQLDALIDQLDEQTRGFSITNDFNEKTIVSRSKEIDANIRKLNAAASVDEASAAIKEVEKNLAEMGVLPGNNWFNSLISIAALGKGAEATGAVKDFIEDVITEVISAIPEVLASTVGAAANGIVNLPSSIVRGLRRKSNELKE